VHHPKPISARDYGKCPRSLPEESQGSQRLDFWAIGGFHLPVNLAELAQRP